MRLIAIEEHILPLSVWEAWASAPPPYDPVSAIADGGETGDRLADLGEGRLALMDEQGVDVQVLSLTTPGLHNLEPGAAVEAARRVNDLIAETCARHPTRFQGFAALPTSDPETAPLELERAVRDLGLKSEPAACPIVEVDSVGSPSTDTARAGAASCRRRTIRRALAT
jgi:predicted TIM-barrel fold metal-dependent hydrolase